MSVTSIWGLAWGAFLGLLGIGVGTGGIKPCVAPFGADQLTGIRDPQAVTSYFMAFYFSINLGSLGSYILTPLFREHVGFWLAFGVPCFLLLVSTVFFVIPSKQYVFIVMLTLPHVPVRL